MEVKIKGFENEVWIRKCAYCISDREVCNICKYVPKDMSKHAHKFYYIKTLTKKSFIRKLFNRELKTKMYKCLCGEIKMEGHQIKRLPSDWEWSYA